MTILMEGVVGFILDFMDLKSLAKFKVQRGSSVNYLLLVIIDILVIVIKEIEMDKRR